MNPASAQQPIVDNLPFATRAPELQKFWVVGLHVAEEPKGIVAACGRCHAVRFAPATPFAKRAEPALFLGDHLSTENSHVTQDVTLEAFFDSGVMARR